MAALLRMEEETEGGNYRRDLQREPGAKCKAGYEVLLLFCFVLHLFIWEERWGAHCY